jgi:hypothetical protein
VTLSVNQRNATKNSKNTSGATGVRWHKPNQKWLASIRLLGKYKHLGYFEEFNDALHARKTAEHANGFTMSHGQPSKEAFVANQLNVLFVLENQH